MVYAVVITDLWYIYGTVYGQTSRKTFSGLSKTAASKFLLTTFSINPFYIEKKNEIKLDWSNIQWEQDLICKEILVIDLPLLVLIPILNNVDEYLVQVPYKIPIERIPKS